ncbi:hypothetical protein [Streptomyces niveus]|uniref:hypothetical protein n=1 Tax=Streptomyces niveus TaxID=193462 RepID=UPI00342DC29C
MDRIRATATPAAPAPRLARAFPTASLASQLLTAAADHLTQDRPTDDLTGAEWGRALALAGARILSGYPAPVAENAAARAITALDPSTWAGFRTRGEWALGLRAAARSV